MISYVVQSIENNEIIGVYGDLSELIVDRHVCQNVCRELMDEKIVELDCESLNEPVLISRWELE